MTQNPLNTWVHVTLRYSIVLCSLVLHLFSFPVVSVSLASKPELKKGQSFKGECEVSWLAFVAVTQYLMKTM